MNTNKSYTNGKNIDGKSWWASLSQEEKDEYRAKKDAEKEMASEIEAIGLKYGYEISFTLKKSYGKKKIIEKENVPANRTDKKNFKEFTLDEKREWARKKGFVWEERNVENKVEIKEEKKNGLSFEQLYGDDFIKSLDSKLVSSKACDDSDDEIDSD